MSDGIARPTLIEAAAAAAAFGASMDARLEGVAGGHINESFRVISADVTLLLQWINPLVFPDPDAVQDNVERVLRHLHAVDPDGGWPVLHSTVDDALRWRNGNGLWRAFRWLPGRVPYEQPRSVMEAEQGGRAFARFDRALIDLDPAVLQPVLPGFHDLAGRLAELDAARSGAAPDRLERADEWLDEVERRREGQLRAVPSGTPRVIHGDTKFSNLLFGPGSGTALAVDYDTVMPGFLAWDFGDMLRSVASSGAEDDPEGGRVRDDVVLACADGFLRVIGPGDRSGLADAPALMAFMLGVRFLTDFLGGDRYFRITRREQNLDRARHQLALAAALEAGRDALAERLERP